VALGCPEAVSHGIKQVSVPKTAPARADLEKVKLAHPPTPPGPPDAAPAGTEPGKPAVKPGAKTTVPKPGPKPLVTKPGVKAAPKKK
jgi:hypothetical protein